MTPFWHTAAGAIRCFYELYAEGQGKPRWGDKTPRYMRAMRLGDVDLMDDVFLPDAIIDYTAIGGSVSPWFETKPWLKGMIAVELFMLFVGDVYVTFDADGRFSFYLGANKPDGYDGPWIQFTPDTAAALTRPPRCRSRVATCCGSRRRRPPPGRSQKAPG